MHSPRIILIVESPSLALFYRTTLEASGFTVQHINDADTALAEIRQQRPACVAIDPIQPHMSAAAFAEAVKKIPAAKPLPVFVMPAVTESWADVVVQSGATEAIPHSIDAARELAMAAAASCMLSAHPVEVPIPDVDRWIPGLLEHLRVLRSYLRIVVRDDERQKAWNALVRSSHAIAELLALGGDPVLGPLARAMELLVDDLQEMPEQFQTSVLRSIGQAADFIVARLTAEPPLLLPTTDGARVLVVDDEPGASMLIAAAMEAAGLEADAAMSPTEAFALVGEKTYDVVLLDIGLPEMNGFDVCTRIRASEGHDSVPILFLTGMTTFQNRAQSTLSGGNDFIGKPFHPVEIGLKALLWISLGRMKKLSLAVASA